jgi:hypothetical protein
MPWLAVSAEQGILRRSEAGEHALAVLRVKSAGNWDVYRPGLRIGVVQEVVFSICPLRSAKQTARSFS